MIAAARFPARRLPANNQFWRPSAIGWMRFSTQLLAESSIDGPMLNQQPRPEQPAAQGAEQPRARPWGEAVGVASAGGGMAVAIGDRILPPQKILAVDVDRAGSRASNRQEPACRGLRHPCTLRPAGSLCAATPGALHAIHAHLP
jgi:hypothetical protein